MAEVITLAAEPREQTGTGAARANRVAGRVPGVVYGGKDAVAHVTFARDDILREVKRHGFMQHLFDVRLNGATQRVLPRDVQFHPVSDQPIHVDFQRISAGSRIRVLVGVTFTNEGASPGLKRGGVLNVVRREIEVTCPADAIPETIVVDLTGLDIGASVHISHITLPEGARPTITGRDFTVATIAPPTVQAVETEVAAAAATTEAPPEGEAPEEAKPGAEGKKPAAEGKKPAAEAKKPAADAKKS
ncbi:MAG: 50S ribosomal protein L25/general stress protein Ctc [Alphaproteobacteria bacterium]